MSNLRGRKTSRRLENISHYINIVTRALPLIIRDNPLINLEDPDTKGTMPGKDSGNRGILYLYKI